MPRLVKGGKFVYGWSRVGERGSIAVLPAAAAEYRLRTGDPVVLIPGSRTSGGFGVARLQALRRSRLAAVLRDGPGGTRSCFRTVLDEKGLNVPAAVLARFGVRPGARLLLVRGSGLALGFIVRGPLVEEAARHPDLESLG
ncbi:MAG TPA: hypothetical protein PK636_00955 [bacterium]|nr:hypothetical protein [bacterium]HPJ71235.1 hypothetical protein [bacterium]HPQ65474.1 hypothetical protein [bacterium]